MDTSAVDLTGRTAKCFCGYTLPSNREKLAFFEYRGPGSKSADRACKCGYFDTAHREVPDARCMCKCLKFEPVGDMPDSFYCGCRGWD